MEISLERSDYALRSPRKGMNFVTSGYIPPNDYAIPFGLNVRLCPLPIEPMPVVSRYSPESTSTNLLNDFAVVSTGV